MIAVVDYGVGNLFSLRSSLDMVGADSVVTSDPDVIRQADKIILPGVGAFRDAKEKLDSTGLGAVVVREARRGKPILGICLGMQMLFEHSYEYGIHEGLGLLRGDVVGMEGKIPADLKIPHIGWNSLSVKADHPIFKYVKDGEYVYYVHSFYGKDCAESTLATSEYGLTVTGVVPEAARNRAVTAEDIAAWAGTISYEVLLAATGRVPREWIHETL